MVHGVNVFVHVMHDVLNQEEISCRGEICRVQLLFQRRQQQRQIPVFVPESNNCVREFYCRDGHYPDSASVVMSVLATSLSCSG